MDGDSYLFSLLLFLITRDYSKVGWIFQTIYDIFKESKEKTNLGKSFSVLEDSVFAIRVVILFLVQGFRGKANPKSQLYYIITHPGHTCTFCSSLLPREDRCQTSNDEESD